MGLALLLHNTQVPLAASFEGLQSVPALLLQDYLIIIDGKADAEEWKRDELDPNKGKIDLRGNRP